MYTTEHLRILQNGAAALEDLSGNFPFKGSLDSSASSNIQSINADEIQWCPCTSKWFPPQGFGLPHLYVFLTSCGFLKLLSLHYCLESDVCFPPSFSGSRDSLGAAPGALGRLPRLLGVPHACPSGATLSWGPPRVSSLAALLYQPSLG